jgi:uncharacterized protein YacL
MELIMENNTSNELLRELARERVHKLRQFYVHLFIYVVVVLIYMSKTYFGAPFNFIPLRYINETVVWIWTFVIAVKGFKLFIKEQFLGTQWEQNKIREIIEKENSLKNKWK